MEIGEAVFPDFGHPVLAQWELSGRIFRLFSAKWEGSRAAFRNFLSAGRWQIREKSKSGRTTPSPEMFRLAQEVVV
jgi:hypothetical protein